MVVKRALVPVSSVERQLMLRVIDRRAGYNKAGLMLALAGQMSPARVRATLSQLIDLDAVLTVEEHYVISGYGRRLLAAGGHVDITVVDITVADISNRQS